MVKVIGKATVIFPTEDFDIVSNAVDQVIGNPIDYKKKNDNMDVDEEFQIPYTDQEEPKKEEETKEVEKPKPEKQKPATPVKEKPKKAPPKKKNEEKKEQKIEENKMEITSDKAEEKDRDIELKTSNTKPETIAKTPSPVKKEESDSDEDMYTPIKALNPMNSNWMIKARVSKKYPVKEWSNARGTGKLINIELVDKYGTQIQATFFNKAVDTFNDLLKEDSVYVFSKGTVKIANQKFTSIKNDYCITFSPYSDIKKMDDDSKIRKVAFSFSTLDEITRKGEGKSLDFIGIVVGSTEVSSINLKSGSTKDKKDYELIDDSGNNETMKITVTLWGTPARKHNFGNGTIVAFKGLKITNYKGMTLNGGDYTGVFEAKPLKLKEYFRLFQWYKNNQNNLGTMK
jgi:ssDNA-binding replication factor A large subunit